MTVRGAMVQMGPHAVDRTRWDWDEVANNPFFCPDPDRVPALEESMTQLRKSGDSAGALVRARAVRVPPGSGAPVYAKRDADLAQAMMSIKMQANNLLINLWSDVLVLLLVRLIMRYKVMQKVHELSEI